MRRLPPPETIESHLYTYYRVSGQRIYLEEQREFWLEIASLLDVKREEIRNIVEDDLRHQHTLLVENWQSSRQQILSPPRHVLYLVSDQELDRWNEEVAAEKDADLLLAFWEICLDQGCQKGVTNLVEQIKKRLNGHFQWTAEQRLWDLYGDGAVPLLFGKETSLMNRVFTLAIRTGRLLNPSHYHKSFIMAVNQPEQSKLTRKLRQRLKQYDLGVKFVENGDPNRISILGLEGGFDFSAVREASELDTHFERHKHDPLINCEIRSKDK